MFWIRILTSNPYILLSFLCYYIDSISFKKIHLYTWVFVFFFTSFNSLKEEDFLLSSSDETQGGGGNDFFHLTIPSGMKKRHSLSTPKQVNKNKEFPSGNPTDDLNNKIKKVESYDDFLSDMRWKKIKVYFILYH